MPVALICHLQRIEPMCPMPAAGAAAPIPWSFSLNLSASLTTAPADATLLPYVTPWDWISPFQSLPSPGPIQLAVGIVDSGVFTLLNGGHPINGTIIPLPVTDQSHGHDGEAMFTGLKKVLSKMTLKPPLGPTTGDRDPFWTPGDPQPTNAKLWAHLQGHLGSLAYPLSQWLNLSLCFKATLPADVVTALAGLTATQQILFYAVPTIQVPFPDHVEIWQPTGVPVTVNNSTTWNMNGQSSVVGGPLVSSVQAYVEAVAVVPLANVPARLVPLQTQWVNGNGWSGARWQSTLTQTLTSTFDLVSRLVDAVRLDSTTTHAFQPGNIPDLTLAALALLRDLGDAGLRPQGNGRGLIDDELGRVKDGPKIPVPLGGNPPPTANQDAYLRGLKRCFRAAVQWSDHLMVLAPPTSVDGTQGPGDVNNWYWQLVAAAPRAKNLIDTLLALPPTTAPSPPAPPPPPPPAVADAVILLDHLEGIFSSDSVVSTLLTNAWQNAAAVQPTPVVLPMNVALSFAPLTADADRPATGTSAFMLNPNNQLTAVPGTGYVTAAYQFAPSQKLGQLNHTLSVRLHYAKAAASPFKIITAFRVGPFPASDFHANPSNWTVISSLTETSTEAQNVSLTFSFDTIIPGDTALITVVFYYEPSAAGTITAVWEAFESGIQTQDQADRIRPAIDFFTTYDRGVGETDALTIANGAQWWFTIPQIDHTDLVTGKSAVYRLTVPTGGDNGVPLFTLEVTAQPGTAGGDFKFAWLAPGQAPIPIPAPAITWAEFRANLNLRIKMVPSATGWDAILGFLNPTATPPWTDLAPTFPISAITGAAGARLRIVGCVTADNIPTLRFQIPSALDILGTPDPLLIAAWFPPTPDDKPLLFWQSAQAMTDKLDQRLPRSRLGEALVTVALPDLLAAMISPDPKQQIGQLKTALSSSLTTYCDTRFGKLSPPWARFFPFARLGSLAANANQLYNLITTAIQDYAKKYVDAKIGDPYVSTNVDHDGLAPNALTARPQPLVIGFDLPGHTANDNGDLELLNLLSGVVLFLTSTRTNNFRCASMARLELYENGVPLTPPLTLDNVLIPFRPSYINEQRITTLSYDNVPLPLNGRDNQLHPNPPLSTDQPDVPRAYQLIYKPASKLFAKPPLLRFGDIYSASVGLLTTGGALPLELQDPQHPAKLRDFTGVADPSPPSAQMKLRYLRHVAISHPRCYDITAPTRSPLPKIPARAKPMAREMNRECYSGELDSSPLWFKFLSQAGADVVWPTPFSAPWSIELTDISLAALGAGATVGFYATGDNTAFVPTSAATYVFGLTITATFDPLKMSSKLTISTAGVAAVTVDLHQSALFDLRFDLSSAGQVQPQIRQSAFDPVLVPPAPPAAPSNYRNIFSAPVPLSTAVSSRMLFGIVLTPAPLPVNNVGSLACTAPILNTNLKPAQYSGQRLLPTVPAGSSPPLADPFNESLPLVLLTPGLDWDGSDSVTLSFGKPSAEFEVWWRTYRDPNGNIGNETTTRINVLAEVSDRRNRAAVNPVNSQMADVDTWVDDPAVDGTLVFEAIPLRLPTFDATSLLVEAVPKPATDNLMNVRGGTVQFNIQQNSSLAVTATARTVLDNTVINTVKMIIYAGEVWEVRVYSRVAQAKFEDPNTKSLAPSLKIGARPYTGKDGNPYYLVTPHCFLVEGAEDVATAQAVVLSNGTVDSSAYTGWLNDLSFGFQTADPTTVTAQYLAQLDLIVVLPASPGPAVATWLQSLRDLVKPLAVPVIVLGAAEAEALGLGTQQAPTNPIVTLNDQASLERQHVAGDYLSANLPVLPWSAPALTNVPAASIIAADSASPTNALVAATDRLQLLSTAATDLAAERRVACFLISSNLQKPITSDNSLVCERFFKGAVRWAARWPLAERIWEAMSPSWNNDAGRIDFVLDRTGTTKFDLLSTFEARHQAWRWQGTPVTRFPFELSDPTLIDCLSDDALAYAVVAAAPLLWDTEGFGRRADTDATSISPVFPLRPLNWLPVDSRLLDSDLRAAYFRYTIVATSRYAGFAPVATLAAYHFANPNAITVDQTDAWRRVLVPCRITAAPPKPVLKLVLPLTQTSTAAGAQSQCPGLLAIFSDIWFQMAGLAETVRAEIELCSYTPPPPPVSSARDFAEYGPDPVESAATITAQTPISQYTPALVTSGPTGTTFDGEAGEALYTKSWFIVEALPLAGQSNFDWNFAKLRFRRGVAAESLKPPLAPVADFAKTTAFDVVSKFDRGGNHGSRSVTVNLLRANGGVGITSIALFYQKDPMDPLVTATITNPAGLTTTASFIAYNKIAVKFEFRAFGTTVKDPSSSTWLITPYVGGEQTRWHGLDQFVWPDPTPTSVLLPTLAVLNQQNTTTAPICTCTPILESDPTDSVWVQILPDSNQTKIQPADGTDATQPISVSQLRIQRWPTDQPTALRVRRMGDSNADIALGRNQPQKGGYSSFVRAIALTAKVTDFRGQPSERFIGIYAGNHTDATLPGAVLRFVPIDSTNSTPPDLGPNNTPSDRPSEVPPPHTLLARVVTLQYRTDDGKAPDNIQDVWAELFAQPKDFAVGDDETGRIISVSPPFGEL